MYIDFVFFIKQDMKLADKLWNKHGENLDEKSLTICSGTDYINVNYQHIVFPDAATAKVSRLSASFYCSQFSFACLESVEKLYKYF